MFYGQIFYERKLLQLGIFDDNEYLEKYIDIILLNKSNSYIKGKMQVHHIIPKMYYSYYGIPIDNSYDNKVNLYYKDHVLAHYYLVFCFKDNIFKYKNLYAIEIILGNKYFPEEEKDLLKDLEDIQCYYELASKLRS